MSTGKRVRGGWLLAVLLVAPAVALACVLAGCSLIGLGIGAAIDASNKQPPSLNGWSMERVGKGARVRVFLRDNHELSGVFGGLEVSPEEYRGRYEAWRNAQTSYAAVPSIGDTITIENKETQSSSGTFLGFEYTSLVLQRGGEASTIQVAYDKIARATTANATDWPVAQLSGLASDGHLPLRSRMILDKSRIPLEQVSRVEVRRAGHAKTIGFAAGLLVDAIVVLAVASSYHGSSCSNCSASSCPYVYSFDGERYVREGDVFPGALFRTTQRSDRLVLPHLAESKGTYRLRLTNELNEISHLDEVKLLVIDGPEGRAVVPLGNGPFRVLAGPRPPIKAADLRGADVLPQVRATDHDSWVSNPFARDPNQPSRARDGVVLEFSKPAGARLATVVLRAEPTPWASSLLREVLALHGANLPAWRAHIEADSTARQEFQAAYGREGHLVLRVWNGARWQEAGFVTSHEATELRMEGIPGDVLKLRLDSTAGLWQVDSVAVDYGSDVALDVTELSSTTTRTDHGEDVTALLASSDHRDYQMDPHHSAVDLVFAAPPRKAGRHRSFALKATGYYTILVPAQGAPQSALFAKLLQEAGALGEFSQRLLHADVARQASEPPKGSEEAIAAASR